MLWDTFTITKPLHARERSDIIVEWFVCPFSQWNLNRHACCPSSERAQMSHWQEGSGFSGLQLPQT
eukprot:3363339-Amphidinium_carterae.1